MSPHKRFLGGRSNGDGSCYRSTAMMSIRRRKPSRARTSGGWGASWSREFATPLGDAVLQFGRRPGRVCLDLAEGPAAGLRIRGGPHVPLDLPDARAAALEAPEVQVPVPANFFLDETAAHFHGDTTRGYAVGDYEVIAVLSCHFSSDLALERQRGNLAKSFAFPAASFSFLRTRSIPNRWRSSPAGGPQGRGASPGRRIGRHVRFGRRTRSPRS